MPEISFNLIRSVSSSKGGTSYFAGDIGTKFLLKTEIELSTSLGQITNQPVRKISTFPNPINHGYINLVFPPSLNPSNISYRIISIAQGKAVQVGSFSSLHMQKIPIKNLPSGIYSLQLISGDDSESYKFQVIGD